MSASASGPQDSSRRPQPASAPQSPSEPAADPDLLERVLQETSELCSTGGPLEGAEREALEEVARRHHGEPLSLDPIGIELVQAVLQSHFPAQPHASQLWQALTVQIALTLFEDPASHDRLQSLWVGLGGSGS